MKKKRFTEEQIENVLRYLQPNSTVRRQEGPRCFRVYVFRTFGRLGFRN